MDPPLALRIEVQILIGAISGALGALATIILTPPLQHYFWKLQRLAELRFATTTEINRLLSEYLSGHISKITGRDPNWLPSRDFFVSLRATSTQLRTLFSNKAWQAFKRAEELLTADGGLGPPGDRITVEHFREAHDRAMKVLYEEIGLKV